MTSSRNDEPVRRRIALIAHDHKKADLRDWARFNRGLLARHDLCATGTTGRVLGDELGLPITCFLSGPLEPQPHDPDVKALLRLAMVWNIPVACNLASADFLISSPLMGRGYHRREPDYGPGTGRPARVA